VNIGLIEIIQEMVEESCFSFQVKQLSSNFFVGVNYILEIGTTYPYETDIDIISNENQIVLQEWKLSNDLETNCQKFSMKNQYQFDLFSTYDIAEMSKYLITKCKRRTVILYRPKDENK